MLFRQGKQHKINFWRSFPPSKVCPTLVCLFKLVLVNSDFSSRILFSVFLPVHPTPRQEILFTKSRLSETPLLCWKGNFKQSSVVGRLWTGSPHKKTQEFPVKMGSWKRRAVNSDQFDPKSRRNSLTHWRLLKRTRKKNLLKDPCRFTVRVKILTGSLVTLENLFPENDRYRYRLEIRMNYHYRYRLGPRSRPLISIVSQLPSRKSFELISSKLPLPLPSWKCFELER